MSTLPQRIALGSFWLSHASFWFTLLLGMYLGNTPVCIPYISGCTSITATGIPDPQAYFFRGGLISACALFIFWWYCMKSWLIQLAPEKPILTVRWMVAIGIFSSVCLIVATAVLRPEKGELPWKVHTIGAVLFFVVSLLVQTRVTLYLRQLAKKGIDIGTSLPFKTKLILAQWGFLLVMIALQLMDTSDDPKNVVEWWMALLIGLFYLSSAQDWRHFKLTDRE
ncbi:hypothetical protein [Bacterioplanoides sp.]|uniref:hypothetical protein n=1 Tax=Bacterioplanoides sp. TaxID=2066072 RepID=UPI003B59F08F